MPNPLGYVDDVVELATKSRPDLIPDITPGRPPANLAPRPTRVSPPAARTPGGGNPNRNPTRPQASNENWPSGDPVADRQFLDDYDARQREEAYRRATQRIDEVHTQDLIDAAVRAQDRQNAAQQINNGLDVVGTGLSIAEGIAAASRSPAAKALGTGGLVVGTAAASFYVGDQIRRGLAQILPEGQELLYPDERIDPIENQERLDTELPPSDYRRGQGLTQERYFVVFNGKWRAPSGGISLRDGLPEDLGGDPGTAIFGRPWGPIINWSFVETPSRFSIFLTAHDQNGNLNTGEFWWLDKTLGFDPIEFKLRGIYRIDGTEEPGWTEPPAREPDTDDDDLIDRLRDVAGGTPPQRHRPDREPDTYGPDGVAEPRLPSGPDPLIGLPGIGLPGIGYPGIEPSLEPSVEPTQLPGGYGTPYPSVGIPGGQPSGGRDRRTGGGSESQPSTYTPDGVDPDAQPQPDPVVPRNPLDPENFIDDDCCGSSGQREILRRLQELMESLQLNPGLIDLTNCDGSGSTLVTLDNLASKITAIEQALSHLNGNTKCPPSLAIPESFEAKAPKIRSQCVIQWKKKDSSASSRWSLTIPHFDEGFKDSINLPAYRKGNWVCTLQLENNSHVIVNAFDKGEGQKVLQACLGYIESQYANNPIFKYTEKTGNLSQVEVEPVYASYYSDGDRKQPAKWFRSLS